jgi:hypothetical protein
MTMNGRFQVADAFRHLDPRQPLASGLTAGFSRIGMKGKVWKIVHQGESYYFIQDDGHPLPYLDIVIVGANQNTSKLYYPPGTYQEDSANAPTCASTNGDAPDPGVAIPQSKTCHDCPHNQWLPNRGGKECQDHRRLAVVVLPYMKTRPRLESPINTPVFFKVPPASLKSFKAYGDMLNNEKVHFASVITRVTFDPTKQFQLNFDVKQTLTNAEAPAILPLLDAPQTRSLIGTIAEIKQVEAKPPDLPAEPQDTGLLGVFGGPQNPQNVASVPAKRGPGRPSAKKAAPPAEAAEQAAAPAEGGEAAPWEDSGEDADLDKLMGDVLGKMTK